jgi:alpha-L-fucosidase
MLNTGPKPDGTIPYQGAEFLRTSGNWIKKYSYIIYRAESSPWGHVLPWGDVTVSDNKLNLCVYDWPLDGKKQKITTSKKNGWVSFTLPSQRPEKLISVIEVILKGEPKVNKTMAVDIAFPTTISVAMAVSEGSSIEEKNGMKSL